MTLAAHLKFVGWHGLSGTNSVFVKIKIASLNLHELSLICVSSQAVNILS